MSKVTVKQEFKKEPQDYSNSESLNVDKEQLKNEFEESPVDSDFIKHEIKLYIDIGPEVLQRPYVVPASFGQSTLSTGTNQKPEPVHFDQQESKTDHGLFLCNICQSPFEHVSSLITHIRSECSYKGLMATGDTPYLCSTCGKPFKRKTFLIKHLESHSQNPAYFCNICMKKFTDESRFAAHKKTHNSEEYSCEICDEKFNFKVDLINHTFTHSSKPFACDKCGKRFAVQYYLFEHQTFHHGGKPYSCNICKKQFSLAAALKKHKKEVHTGRRPFTCSMCRKKFLSKTSLFQHQRKQHIHTCNVCEAIFKCKQELSDHKSTHTEQSEFHCSMCDKQFTSNVHMNMHQRLCSLAKT